MSIAKTLCSTLPLTLSQQRELVVGKTNCSGSTTRDRAGQIILRIWAAAQRLGSIRLGFTVTRCNVCSSQTKSSAVLSESDRRLTVAVHRFDFPQRRTPWRTCTARLEPVNDACCDAQLILPRRAVRRRILDAKCRKRIIVHISDQ